MLSEKNNVIIYVILDSNVFICSFSRFDDVFSQMRLVADGRTHHYNNAYNIILYFEWFT